MEIKKEDLVPSQKYLNIVKKAEVIAQEKKIVKKKEIDKDVEYRLFLKQKQLHKEMFLDISLFDQYWKLYIFIRDEFEIKNKFTLKRDLIKAGYVPLSFLSVIIFVFTLIVCLLLITSLSVDINYGLGLFLVLVSTSSIIISYISLAIFIGSD